VLLWKLIILLVFCFLLAGSSSNNGYKVAHDPASLNGPFQGEDMAGIVADRKLMEWNVRSTLPGLVTWL